MAYHLDLGDVCSNFVKMYYDLLQEKPQEVCDFYMDSSMISRPGLDGTMFSVSTKEGINELISSLNYKNMKFTTKTSDPLVSHDGGILILVTGFVELNNLNRNFAQTFFLARQPSGFFVASDVFRFVDGDKSTETSSSVVNVPTVENFETGVLPVQNGDSTLDGSVPEPAKSVKEDKRHDQKIVGSQSDKSGALQKETSSQAPVRQNESRTVASASSDDVPKQSYASIVRFPKVNKDNTLISSNGSGEVTSVKIENKASTFTPSATKTHAANSDNVPKNISQRNEAESYPVFVRGLPLSITAAQLEEAFKKFGPIIINGVQVRSKPGVCYGFVKFSTASSQQKALEASPFFIHQKEVFVEVKRGSSPQGNNRGRVSHGAYGGDSFRGRSYEARGSYAGHGSYSARGEFGNRGNGHGYGNGYRNNDYNDRRNNDYNDRRGDYANHGRAFSARNGYQPVNQAGRNGMPPNGVIKQSTVAA